MNKSSEFGQLLSSYVKIHLINITLTGVDCSFQADTKELVWQRNGLKSHTLNDKRLQVLDCCTLRMTQKSFGLYRHITRIQCTTMPSLEYKSVYQQIYKLMKGKMVLSVTFLVCDRSETSHSYLCMHSQKCNLSQGKFLLHGGW